MKALIEEYKIMKLIKNLLVIMPFLFTGNLYAGSGHSHDKDGGHSNHGHSHGTVSKARVIKKAKYKISRLVKKGKVDNSWKGLNPVSVTQKKFGKKMEWVVEFHNQGIKDATKQKLFVFYSLDGHYIATNYTGK